MAGQKIGYRVERWRLIDRVLRRAVLRRTIRRATDEAALLPVSFCAYKDPIGIEVLCSGTFEREILILAKAILQDHLSRENIGSASTVAIDIGANIGTHALFFSTLVGRVLAFEPNPSVALVCQANQLAAGRSNVEVFDRALSDHNGKASLFVSQGVDFGGGTLESSGQQGAPIFVSIERGDDFIQPRLKSNERIVLVKADVEGHEPKVFMGLGEILKQHRPVVFFESPSSSHLLACRQALEPNGYTRFDVIETDWGDNKLSRLLSLISGKTEISLQPIDLTEDHFRSSVVARPGAS